jgi:hypothetical protein
VTAREDRDGRSTRRRGRVGAFDAEAGLGEVRAEDDRAYPFHCVAIADGTRRVEVGAAVTFTVGPGLPGRWEAFDIRPG